jgi:stage IV sporulation protein FB
LNIPVRIETGFWIFLIFFTEIYRSFSMESVLLGLVLFFSLLVHEYGHALTAMFFGARPQITLEAFGGSAAYNSRMTPKQDFLITLNGPLLECVLILVSYAVLKLGLVEHHYARYFWSVMMRLNILWVALNLIPVVPLDGGRLLRNVLERKWGPQGTRASLYVGMGSVILAAPYLFYHGLFFFGVLMVIFGFQNYQMLQGVRVFKSENELDKAKKVLKKLLKSQEDYALVGKFSKQMYGREPTFEVAILNSEAFVHLNQPLHAGAWLEAASRFEGCKERAQEILQSQLYEGVRDHEAFKSYAEKILS